MNGSGNGAKQWLLKGRSKVQHFVVRAEYNGVYGWYALNPNKKEVSESYPTYRQAYFKLGQYVDFNLGKLSYIPGLVSFFNIFANNATGNQEAALGNFVDTATSVENPFKGFGLGIIRRGIKGQADDVANSSGGRNLAIGFRNNLDEFAAATGSETYVQWNNGSRIFDPDSFLQFADEASEINLNVRSFSWSSHANWVRTGNPDTIIFDRRVTSWEIDQVLSNPSLRSKLNFHVFPPSGK